MKIILLPRAEKELRKLPKFTQVIVAKKIRGLKNETLEGVSFFKKLSGYKNIFRIRLGDYRLVYKLDKEKIFIISISHRKEVYEKIKRLLG